MMETLSTFIRFTKEELQDLLMNLEQCKSEGYLNYGNPAYLAMTKLEMALEQWENDND